MDIEELISEETADKKKLNVNNTQLKKPFNFPFEPYNIQVELMKVAYETFEKKKFALFESPTGTGKSLSLICSSLTWLRDYQNKVKNELENRKKDLLDKIEKLKKEEENSGDWLSIQTKVRDLNKETVEINRDLEKINKFEERSKARRHAKLHNVPLEHYLAFTTANATETSLANQSVEEMDVSSVSDLPASQGSNIDQDEENIEKRVSEQDEGCVRPKVYYASRTHSQLAQFINEIKRTRFADINIGVPVKVTPLASRANYCVNPEVTKLKDSSAINERCVEMQRDTNADKRCPYIKVKQVTMLKEDILSSVQDIEDIVARGKAIGACPYYASRMSIAEAEVVVLPYNNLLHHETRKASSLDLTESIVILDEAHNILETICSIHSAPITGQQLIGSHTILSRYYRRFHNRMAPRNAEMMRTIIQCLTALIDYLNTPKAHLFDYENPRSVSMDTGEPVSEANTPAKLKDVDEKKMTPRTPARHEELMTDVSKFIKAAKIERFNIFRIIDYFNRSQLARKLLGFYKQDITFDLSLEISNLKRNELQLNENVSIDSPAWKKRKMSASQPMVGQISTSQPVADFRPKTTEMNLEQTNLEFLKRSNPILEKGESIMNSYPIYTLIEFLKSLTNLAHDGKVLTDFYDGNIKQSVLKFILLNPSSQFKQMITETRSIVLAGGTMQPFSEFVDLLFGPLGIGRDRLTMFSCGHVIDKDRLYLSTLSNGCTEKPLELSFKTRTSLAYLDEIGMTVQQIAGLAPAGMICFFPSYDYEQLCYNRWNHIGVVRKIENKYKQIFREPKQANQVKAILDEYSRVVEKTKDSDRGAMLLCVVGGKMSEGINFNDDLGRCIVMVGLPYANIKSGELQLKMNYYDRTCKRANDTTSLSTNQPSAGQQYYENLCIKGINQSIGRAVRHKEDYSAIILLDRRYTIKTQIRNGLPSWMRSALVDHNRFVSMFGQLKAFFNYVQNK